MWNFVWDDAFTVNAARHRVTMEEREQEGKPAWNARGQEIFQRLDDISKVVSGNFTVCVFTDRLNTSIAFALEFRRRGQHLTGTMKYPERQVVLTLRIPHLVSEANHLMPSRHSEVFRSYRWR